MSNGLIVKIDYHTQRAQKIITTLSIIITPKRLVGEGAITNDGNGCQPSQSQELVIQYT